jgi:hypothetical protein
MGTLHYQTPRISENGTGAGNVLFGARRPVWDLYPGYLLSVPVAAMECSSSEDKI